MDSRRSWGSGIEEASEPLGLRKGVHLSMSGTVKKSRAQLFSTP